MTTAEHEPALYRFDPADGSGLFLGLGLVQCILIGAGLVVSIAALTQGAPLPLAALPLLAGVATSFARVGGYGAWEWIPLGAGWCWARLGRGRRWFAPLPLLVDGSGRSTPLPPCLAGLTISDQPWRGRQRLGAVHDTSSHSLTAALRVAGPAFVVASRAEQARMVAGWGDILNQFATEGGAVAHLSWTDLAAPSGLSEHRAWLGATQGPDTHPEAAASYAELLAGAASRATAHEVVVTLTVSRDRLGRRRHVDPDEALARALASSMEALLRGARSAGLIAGDPLSAVELRRVLRSRLDPLSAQPKVSGDRLVERLGLVGEANAGPMALEAGWRHLRVDAAWHRTYHVSVWPRLPVGPGWLEPFLAGAGVTRTMTVVFAPVSAHQSRRRIERDLVKLDSDAAVREDKGRRVDARHRRATQSLLERETELVAGFAEMGYLGLVGVAAASEDELEAAAEAVEQQAREAGMELRCLDGRQDLAWAAALPLGLAPRNLIT